MELGEEYRRPTTKWVKGELLDRLDAETVDSRSMIATEAGLSPFERLPWFQRVAAHWDGDLTPFIAHAWNAGSHCWLFLARDGNRMVALANWYSLAFRAVFTGGPDRQLLAAVARRLAKSPSVAPTICLSPVPTIDGSSDLIVDAFGSNGWFAFRDATSVSWTIDVEGKSFAQYWEERPGELRSTYKRKAKKAEIVCTIFTDFNEEAWADYLSVYEASWKSAEGSIDFLRDMAEHEAASGGLRLGIARLDGQSIAAQLWIVADGVAYIHKLAYHQDFDQLSPGTILSHDLFRHVIDIDKVRSIDFGTGDDPYKAVWMDRSSALDTITLHKRSNAAGWAGAARDKLSRLAAPFRKA